jgi:hypothetical protein
LFGSVPRLICWIMSRRCTVVEYLNVVGTSPKLP